MAKNRISDLRDHLFETIEALKDGSMDISRARAISDVAQTIVDSARVEVELVRAINDRAVETVRPGGSFFEPVPEGEKRLRMVAAGSDNAA